MRHPVTVTAERENRVMSKTEQGAPKTCRQTDNGVPISGSNLDKQQQQPRAPLGATGETKEVGSRQCYQGRISLSGYRWRTPCSCTGDRTRVPMETCFCVSLCVETMDFKSGLWRFMDGAVKARCKGLAAASGNHLRCTLIYAPDHACECVSAYVRVCVCVCV